MATSDFQTRLVTVALFVAAIVITFVGVAYFTETAAQLPAFFPGHVAQSPTHHVEYGLLAATLAVLALTASWLTTTPERRDT